MPATMMPSMEPGKTLNFELTTCRGEKGVAGLPWFLDNCFRPQNAPQAEDEIMDFRILKTESSQGTKPADQCCLLRHILRLYLGMVFKNYQTSNKLILRKLSSLANSFLTIKKDLRLCHARMTCPCGEEAMEKSNQILSRFKKILKFHNFFKLFHLEKNALLVIPNRTDNEKRGSILGRMLSRFDLLIT
ncbi:Interleukin-20 [Myotis brandtii]|uniref:Interleukin-20 n=1 Tax=Myotis brandtii TaxID=109478 RepID=S7NPB6_MYOBR|nr:Interleukin-20 [Myotis brandtii]